MADCGHSHGQAHGHSHEEAGPDYSQPEDRVHAAPASGSSFLEAVGDLAAEAPPEASLAVNFSQAERLFHHIDVGAPDNCVDHDVRRHADDALKILLNCALSVRKEAMFSSNETIDDIKTEDLRYLLIEYYIASLRHKYSGGSPAGPTNAQARMGVLALARVGLESFLERCALLGVLPPAECDALGISSACAGAEESTEQPTGGPPRRPAPAPTREAKIERFKRNSAAKKRLAELAALHAREAALLARSSGILSDGVGGNAHGLSGDDASRREASILGLQVAARQAVDDLHGIRQEVPLVQHSLRMAASAAAASGSSSARREAAHAAGSASRSTPAHGSHGYEEEDERMDPGKRKGPPAEDLSIDENRPGLLVTHIDPTFALTRETIKAAVFTSSHRPPTLGLEDWGEQVLGMTVQRTAEEAKQAAARPKTKSQLAELGIEVEDDHDAHDLAQWRERRMDEWKDGVPKGMGNTKRI